MMNTDYYKWATDIVNGKIESGKLIKLACKRFFNDINNPKYEFRIEQVDRVLNFIKLFKHYSGDFAGNQFELLPWQQFLVANLYGLYVKDSNKRKYTTSYLQVSRKSGKALSLDTPIPTPTGWTTMGDLKQGDLVLDRQGNPTKVTYTTEIQYNRDCYKVTFEDGEEIIADAEHQWQIISKSKNGVYTTAQLKDSFKRIRKDGKGTEYFYRVPMNKALSLPEADLPIDPYILGLWLGDGDSNSASFTVHKDDLDMYKCLGDYKLSFDKRNTNVARVSLRGDKGKNNSILGKKLKDLGLLNNKYIPNLYLRASEHQRWELLKGLMDTDGYCSKDGECEIQQKNHIIAEGICELLSSLGIKYSVKDKMSKCNNKECGIVKRIKFFTDKHNSCFKLQRKHDRLKDSLNKRMLNKSIINIEPVESVPVKCIQVDNPESLYLCGKHFTVTHNTMLSAALCLYNLIADKEPSAEVLLLATTREQASIALKMTKELAYQLDPNEKTLRILKNEISFRNLPNFLKVLSSNGSKLDGYGPSFALLDEYHEHKTPELYDVMLSGQGARRNPMLFVITTAGFNLFGPCKTLRDTCEKILTGDIEDESQFAMVFEMDKEDNWKDDKNWIKCSPNMNVTVQSDYIAKMITKAKNNPGEMANVKTKVLNIWVESKSEWVDVSYYEECKRKLTIEDFKGLDVYVGVDLSMVRDLTAVSFFAPIEDNKYLYKTFYFLPEVALEGRGDYKFFELCKKTGELIVTDGNVVDYDAIIKCINDFNKECNIVCVAYDNFNSSQWALKMQDEGYNLIDYSQNLKSFNAPTKDFEILYLQDRLIIDDNRLTKYCISNVELKMDYCGNYKPDKCGTSKDKKIDGVISMIQCIGGYNVEGHNIPFGFSINE